MGFLGSFLVSGRKCCLFSLTPSALAIFLWPFCLGIRAKAKTCVREPARLGAHVIFDFPMQLMKYVNSKPICFLPSKRTSYVPHIVSVMFDKRLCVCAKELRKRQNSTVALNVWKHTCTDAIKDYSKCKHVRVAWFMHHENVLYAYKRLQGA